MKKVTKAAIGLHRFLHHPFQVFLLCLTMICMSLVMSGSLMRIYSLNRQQKNLNQQIVLSKAKIMDLDRQIKLAQDPNFMARQAMDHYDLADENDLVFLFSED